MRSSSLPSGSLEERRKENDSRLPLHLGQEGSYAHHSTTNTRSPGDWDCLFPLWDRLRTRAQESVPTLSLTQWIPRLSASKCPMLNETLIVLLHEKILRGPISDVSQSTKNHGELLKCKGLFQFSFIAESKK